MTTVHRAPVVDGRAVAAGPPGAHRARPDSRSGAPAATTRITADRKAGRS